jgi:hypothetical protein
MHPEWGTSVPFRTKSILKAGIDELPTCSNEYRTKIQRRLMMSCCAEFEVRRLKLAMKWSFLKKVIKSIGSLTLAVCLLGGRTFAYDVTLAWDPKTESNLAGYKVYFGTASRSYGVPLDAGKNATFTVTGLNADVYYFSVTAYYTSGDETGYSNEVTETFVQSSGSGIPAPSNVVVK